MKKLVLVFCAFTLTFGMAMAQQAETKSASMLEAKANGAEITFAEEAFEFGDIYQGDVVEHTFAFENTGNAPLILSNVKTTCGCTAPKWSRDPIAPGETSEIQVRFNSAGKLNKQNKIITIVSNAINQDAKIRITTNVLPKKDKS